MTEAEAERFEFLNSLAVFAKNPPVFVGEHNVECYSRTRDERGKFFLRVRRTKSTYHEPNDFILRYTALEKIEAELRRRIPWLK
jgi:hypothetical protein